MKRSGWLILVAVITACGVTLPEDGELELRAWPSSAEQGTVAAVFINNSGSTVGIGHLECMTGVQQQVDGAWQSVDVWPGEQHCILPLYLIAPRRAYAYETIGPTAPGTYRLVVTASVEGNQPDLPGGGRHSYVVSSAPFEVHP